MSITFVLLFIHFLRHAGKKASSHSLYGNNLKYADGDTVIIFSYSYKVPDRTTINLVYFVKHSVEVDRNKQFLILVIGKTPYMIQEWLKRLSHRFKNFACLFLNQTIADACAIRKVFLHFNLLLRRFKYIFVLNDTARGPFATAGWIRRYTVLLNNKTRQVGSYLNCETFPHIQSFAYAMYMKDFNKTIHETIDCSRKTSKQDVIHQYEIGISRDIISAGREIKGLFPPFAAVNSFSRCRFKKNPSIYGFRGLHADKHDVIFVKTAGTGVRNSIDLDIYTARQLECFSLDVDMSNAEIYKQVDACLYQHPEKFFN